MSDQHTDLQMALENGKVIQFKNSSGQWIDVRYPSWISGYEYRIKPEEVPLGSMPNGHAGKAASVPEQPADPYANLKAARAAGLRIQIFSTGHIWVDEDPSCPWEFTEPPKSYRIKPEDPAQPVPQLASVECVPPPDYDPASVAFSAAQPSTFDVPGFELLSDVLIRAYTQAATGKGAKRHGRDKPFHEQPMQDLIRLHGLGFATGQASKKAQEALGMVARGEQGAAVAELLGAINYLAGAVIAIDSY